ncbi:MAG: general secretion pathway protein GspJ [Bdellovibrio sp. CG10_big_fil_rev_8_21_14_0_10_47_8]|nr:MAG: general secretion pathway protein GspJ [Bdellovibrio sp. CG10_big_fil_rev_8_21_14_0_10_47_8]
MKNSRGLTLLEVMIVLVIMATLTVLSSQSIQQAIKAKGKLQTQIEEVSQVRDSLKVIERDLNLAFHYSDLETELKELTKKKRIELSKTKTSTGKSASSTTTLNPAGAYNPNDPNDPLNKKSENRVDPTTQFIGKENSLYFPTLSSSRLHEDNQQADFVKVGYLLKSCRKPGQKAQSQCLIRVSGNIIEGDLTKGGQGVVLLENVSEFKLRYFGKGKQDWSTTWDTTQSDSITKNRFPDAVEISLTVEKEVKGAKSKKLSMQIVVPIRFPNNDYQDSLNQQAQAQQNGTGATNSGNGFSPNNGFNQNNGFNPNNGFGNQQPKSPSGSGTGN